MQSDHSSAARVWTCVADRLKTQMQESTFQQWFANIVPLKVEDATLVLGVADDFFADWLRDMYDEVLIAALTAIDGVTYQYRFEVGYLPEVLEKEPEAAVPEPAAPPPEARGRQAGKTIANRHTFENFVVGEENRYAFAAAHTAAENPGVYNPLYIYGGTGIGKTHLLQAVATEYLNRNPRGVVRYATCEEILNSYVESLQKNTQAEFRASVREVDMLLVDDVHMLANKPQLQQQFFDTFNTLYHRNRQIILTSDKQPCEIKGLEERLVSRFESGVTTEISPPGFETRLAILKLTQQEHLIKLDESILQFIASNISSSVRRLKGALLRLVAFASAMSTTITMNRAEELLHSLIEEENASKLISIEVIQRKVAEHFDIRLNDILSAKRPRNIAEPRMVAMYLCRRLTSYSFPEIGAAFGKNHATVMNAMKKVPELCDRSEGMRRSVALIERQLRS
ncbi:chromosomal replication initiator protein DnaA [Victivallis sp. Marseille-Q1083]|uniref:chromosomal replication initiator protein DnaA n=1 Tax=Victivallis sp. Marseille-Q1083 TaxID=2717288 RepID=UPI00158AA4CF|nr:chromosomal replication initiator protein DnaA [Victivallis sp. Marseille-Q1083]